MLRATPCVRCRHVDWEARNKTGHLFRCAAFSQIPEEILRGENSHRTPYPGDNGIVFERVDDDELNRRAGIRK